MTIGIRTKRRPAPRRGPTDSNDFNAFSDEVATDLVTLAAEVNAQEAEIDRTHLIRYRETAAMRAQMRRMIKREQIQGEYAAAAGEPIITVVDFRGLLGPDFEVLYTGFDQGRRVRVEPLYGQVLLPYNSVKNRVYSVNPDTGKVVLPGTIETSVTGYDQGGTAVSGTRKYAVNGNNQDYWIRSVRFPLASDVDYVEVDYQINLPEIYTSYVNMVSVHPFPLGEVDIREIKYSTTTADPSIDLPGFTAVNNAEFQRWHFSSREMTKIKIKIRQRVFTEQDGFKVFHLGMQEFLLHLVEFDKTAVDTNPLNSNGLIVKVSAPSGYIFETLTRFSSSPAYATGSSDNKIYFKIYKEEALTNLLWNSFTDPAPQSSVLDIESEALSDIYVALSLGWDGANLVSPVVDHFAMKYTTVVSP